MNYLLLMGAVLLIPYNLMPTSLCGALLSMIGCMYLLKLKSALRVNKYIFYSIVLFNIISILSLMYSKDINLFFDGFITYLSILLFYLLFSNLYKEKILNYFVYIISISLSFFIVYQGFILNKRVDGTFAYANTYGLLMLITLYINEIRTNEKFKSTIQFILILGILFTESRNTIIYLCIFIIISAVVEIKEKSNYSIALNIFTTVLLYILFKCFGLGSIFTIPILYIPIYYFYNKCKTKTKEKLSLICYVSTAIIFCTLIFAQANFNLKLSNINMNSSTLQERFIYYEDAIKYIAKNPLGSGINSFVYKQYSNQSAFYDVKYIHNSLLQVCYDIGFLGLALFIFIFVYGVLLIHRSSEGNSKILKIAVFLTIYFHSLLDFDFSFPTIFIVVVMMIAFWSKGSSIIINNYYKKAIIVTSMVISIYVFAINSLLLMGNFYSKKDTNKSLRFYTLSKEITFKNPEIYALIAQNYRENNMTAQCLENLKTAEQINPEDPAVKMNIAFTYEKIGDDKSAIRYFDAVLEQEKYYEDIYKEYHAYLDKLYEETGDTRYKIKINNLEELHSKNCNSLNEKAIYLKNQLSK